MLKALFSLFKRSDSKPRHAVRSTQNSMSKPKVAPTRIGGLDRIAYLSLRRKTTMEKLKVGEQINNGQ